MPSNTPLLSRPQESVFLSPAEGLFWRLEEGSTGAFRVTVLFQLEGRIEANYLTVALKRLQQRHPKLRATIADGDGRLRYEFEDEAPPIPFEITDYGDEELPWRQETRRLMQIGFAAVGPLAAVGVLRSASLNRTDVLLNVHHAIADGLSAIMLIDDLLIEYANAEQHVDVERRPALPAVSVPRARRTNGWRDRVRLFLRFLRIQREEKRGRQTPLPEASNITPQSQWLHWTFSRQETLKMVKRCRKERTSVGGMLVAAACCGIMQCLPLSEAVFKCQFPLNIRDLLEGANGPVTPQDLGCFVSVMNEFYVVPRQPVFWDLARRAHQDVQTFMCNGGPASYYNLLAMAVEADRRFPRGTKKAMPSSTKRVTLLATNYGVLNTRDQYGSLRPQGCTLIFKNDVVGPSLVMEALVLGQRLNIGFAADGLEPAFWEQLHLAVHQHLLAALFD